MKKLFVWLFFVVLILSTSCYKDSSQLETTNSTPIFPSSNEKLVEEKVNQDNYYEYINIHITQLSQSSSIISTCYIVNYRNGMQEWEERLSPPSGLNIVSYSVAYHTYQLSTLFSVSIQASASNYMFNDVKFGLRFSANGLDLTDVWVRLNSDGSFYGTFSAVGRGITPYQQYHLNMSAVMVSGTVSYYEVII